MFCVFVSLGKKKENEDSNDCVVYLFVYGLGVLYVTGFTRKRVDSMPNQRESRQE